MTHHVVRDSNGYCFEVLRFGIVFTQHYVAILIDIAKCLEIWRQSFRPNKDKLIVRGIADHQNPVISYSVEYNTREECGYQQLKLRFSTKTLKMATQKSDAQCVLNPVILRPVYDMCIFAHGTKLRQLSKMLVQAM